MPIRSIRRRAAITGMALIRDLDGKIPDSELDRMMYEFQLVRTILNGGISVGSGASSSQAGNHKGQFVDAVFPSAANTVMMIAHGLNTTPTFAIPVLKDRACDLYDSNFGAGWGPSYIQLFSSVASAKVKLLILA